MTEQRSHNPNDLLEARLTIHESAEKMKRLLRESRPHGYPTLYFNYQDAADMVHVGHFMTENGLDRSTAELSVVTHQNLYNVKTFKSPDSSEAMDFGVEVKVYDSARKIYDEASPEQESGLADILMQLDEADVKDRLHDTIATTEAQSRSWLGWLAHRRNR